MLKQILFNGAVAIGISELGDGNMRFFEGDEDEVILNQEKLGKVISLTGNNIARVRTTYDGRKSFTEYYEITNENLSEYTINSHEKQIPVSDGLITKSADTGLFLPLADCLGIVVFDEEHNLVGLLHAGRQNVEQFGPKKFIEYLVENFESNPAHLQIYFSPHATKYQLFEFDNKYLPAVAKEQLVEAGVMLGNIIDPEISTVDAENFPSHSNGDHKTRFAIAVKRIA